MKLKNLFTTLGLTLAVGIGVAVGVGGQRANSEVKAAEGQTYYLVGSTKAGGETPIGWETDANEHAVVDGGEEVIIEFEKDDQFKFILEGTWTGALGVDALMGSARGYFDGGNDGNIHCDFGGNYKVSIKDSKVYINCYNTLYADVYVQLQEYESTYVYAFDETTNSGATLKPLGVWPGTRVTEFTDGVDFAADYSIGGGIGKITVPYIGLSSTNIIIHDNNGQQSGDCTLGKNHFYWEKGSVGDVTNGACAKTVYEISKAVEKATNQSACSVSAEDADKVLTDNSSYLAYSKVKNSTLYTWKDSSRAEKQNFKFEEVIALLQEIAANGSPARRMSANSANNATILLVVIISSVALVSVGGFFLLRKKREN